MMETKVVQPTKGITTLIIMFIIFFVYVAI